MENLKIDLSIRDDEFWFNIGGKELILWGKFQYIMYYKTTEHSSIWTNSPKELLAWNIPTFSLN